MKDQTYYWASLVGCYIPETEETKISFMAFYARNRFNATRCINQELAKIPEYLDKYGQLRPIRLLELRQIKEWEREFYERAYFEAIHNVYCNNSQHTSRNSA